MQPLANALDILQREKNMYLGYLIPTLLHMERQLGQRKTMIDKTPLKHCDVLRRTVRGVIRAPRRFGEYLKDKELQLAAVLLPNFKLRWVSMTGEEADEDELKDALVKAAQEEQLDGEKVINLLS